MVRIGRIRAIRGEDRALLIVIERNHDAELRMVVPELVTYTADQRTMIGLRIPMVADPPVLCNISAIILIFRNEIDDTGNGVGTIDRAASIIEDLNAIDGR
jgi:hypothetical protein